MSSQNENTSGRMSQIEKIIAIFTNPAAAYAEIKSKPTWLLPIILILFVGIISSVLMADILLDLQKDQILQSERIPEEQKDRFLEEFENPGFWRMYGFSTLGVIFYTFAGFAISALALMGVGNFMMGGETTFKENFALFSWGNLIGILASIVKVPIILSKNSIEVYTSLAVLMDPSQSKTTLFQILDAFDIFAIWKIIVIAIGMSIIYNFSRKSSYTAVISLYVVYTIITIGLSQLFGGLF